MKRIVKPASRWAGMQAGVSLASLFVALLALQGQAIAAPAIPETPLIATQAAIPMNMLVVGRDHTLFFEAYNDASDIDGDGVLDLRFKPGITYYGLFDSSLCYTHSGGGTNDGLFTPVSVAVDGKCPGKWSGNWLNYATTSRIDALRKVLYGGYREVDTESRTILRRAYIPQDAHSWAKEYTSESVDGYRISDYTPLAQPSGTGTRRHFFGNVTMNGGTNCATLDNCSNLPPLLSVVTNSTKRVWDWASTEKLVLRNDTHGGSRNNYTVRVEVCTDTFNGGCKRYPNGNYKPIGLLHEYGENDAMLFGLLTGSYNKNMSGGVLRKVVASFAGEVDSSSGVFTANAKIVKTLNSLRIRDFNNGRSDGHYRNGSFRTGIMPEGNYVDWGNPVGEMMYEALRYFSGKSSPTAEFSTSGSHDQAVGLSEATWDDPYSATSAARAAWCAKPNMLVMSSANVSYDSDQLPGSFFAGFSGDLSGMDVSALADKITVHEPDVPGLRYIGAVGSNEDFAPTAKDVTTLGNIRGLAPEEPTRQGSYYSASVAHFGKINDLNPVQGSQTTDTFVVALASPLPKLEFNLGGKLVSLVPFAKTIDGASTDRRKGKYQPTDPIVDFYIEEYSSDRVKFRINYEADEQGNDFDMDVIVEYDIVVNANNTLTVKVKPTYESTGSNQNIGYVISGTDRDGTYLVVQDKKESLDYFLNVPPGRSAGYCDASPSPADCAQLPWIGATPPGNESIQTFAAGGAGAATTLNNPLWFAAKWGGFVDRNNNGIPDLQAEWDAMNDGMPDTYILVQNPLRLKEALKRSFDTIIERSASAGNITSNGQQLRAESRVFQTQFNSATWDGELLAYDVGALGVSDSPAWRASALLPAAASRNIFTWKDASTKGIAFEWAQLSSTQQSKLGTSAILNYLRGDQSNEKQSGGTLRSRVKKLGDIVHSSPYYVKDTDTVYVGGNDGMLHAFSASSGVELFAYIPALVFDKLASLASPDYQHTYFVDGDIAVSTRTETPGQNILVASTGRGAKGLFALDVTDPGGFEAADVLWEYSAASDNDLGFVLGRPQIAKLENDVTAVILGNGHNSVNGRAVLYLINLATGALIKKIDTEAGGDNALSTPALLDSDNNGKVDTVYAGDLKGNVWRFDLSGSNPTQWKSYYRSGSTPQPFFTALDADNNPQPITAQVTTGINTVTSDTLNYGKRYIFFGTGSYVYANDPSDQKVQTWYGLIDEDVRIAGGRASLAQRTIETDGTVGSYAVRVFSEATEGDMVGKKGWYVDLKDPDPRGERIVTRSVLYRLLEPVLIASSIIPDPDPCVAGGSGFINAINPFTGGRLLYPPFDLNNDGRFNDDDKLGGGDDKDVVGSVDLGVGMPGEATLVGDRLVVGGSTGEIEDIRVNIGSKRLGRISWREIVRD